MNVDLDDGSAMQQLQAEQRALLDTIDDLRILDLDKIVNLPQLIVVGDQSAGKSSVLEAISRVHFPIKDGVCTRFATELILRQSPQTRIDVKIQAKKTLDSFDQSSFSESDLPRIIEEAKKHMGVDADSRDVSEDVLRVQISGPNVPQLTLVDLPGFYRNETESQSSKGIEIANRLSERYMQQENSIILAVISAQEQLAAQKVVREAKKHDPACSRILGIITKPDKLEEGSDTEQIYLRLAQNKEEKHNLCLGWHVLRNRAHKEAGSADSERDQEEKRFFQSGVWSTLSLGNRGVETLRGKLSHVLLSHIQQKLPRLIKEIEDQIRSRQSKLRKIGDKRSSPAEVRKYLITISTRFQRLAFEAIQGNYLDDFFGGLYPDSKTTSYADWRVRKLRALIRDMNRAFYYVLSNHGARRNIQWGESDNEDDDSQEEGRMSGKSVSHAKQYLEPLIRLYELHHAPSVSVKDLKKELEQMASENQGVEFPGSANDRVTLRLFRDQAQPWKDLARQHINLVTEIGRSFAEQLILHVVGEDSKTADSLLKTYIHPYFDERNRDLQKKLDELLQHYKSGYDPQPLYEDFCSIANHLGNKRIVKRLSDRLCQDHPDLFAAGEKSKSKLTREVLAQAILSKSADLETEFSVGKIIDNMSAYYELSLKTFTNNIIILALENCLVAGIPEILTADKVHDLSDDSVTALAAESEEVRSQREELENQLRRLQKGWEVCKEYRPRQSVKLSQGPSSKPVLNEPPNFSANRNTSTPSPSSTPTPSKGLAQESSLTPTSTPTSKFVFANLNTNTNKGTWNFDLPTQHTPSGSSKSPSDGAGSTNSVKPPLSSNFGRPTANREAARPSPSGWLFGNSTPNPLSTPTGGTTKVEGHSGISSKNR